MLGRAGSLAARGTLPLTAPEEAGSRLGPCPSRPNQTTWENPGPPPPGPRFPFARGRIGKRPGISRSRFPANWESGIGNREIPHFPREKTRKRGSRESGFVSEEHQLQWTRNILSRECHASALCHRQHHDAAPIQGPHETGRGNMLLWVTSINRSGLSRYSAASIMPVLSEAACGSYSGSERGKCCCSSVGRSVRLAGGRATSAVHL